jgi:hypothetical protein
MKNPYNPETEPASWKWFDEKQATETFKYKGFMCSEAQNFFKGNVIEEERDGCAVVGSFIKLSEGGTHLPSKGDKFKKLKDGTIVLDYSSEVIKHPDCLDGSWKCLRSDEPLPCCFDSEPPIEKTIRDEMDADMEDSGMSQGEIESCLNHWFNKYTITYK